MKTKSEQNFQNLPAQVWNLVILNTDLNLVLMMAYFSLSVYCTRGGVSQKLASQSLD